MNVAVWALLLSTTSVPEAPSPTWACSGAGEGPANVNPADRSETKSQRVCADPFR